MPRPKNMPVEMWQPIVSGPDDRLHCAERYQRGGRVDGGVAGGGDFPQYKDANSKYGRDLELGENLALEVGFYIAGSQEEAMNKLRPFHDERYKWFAPFGFVRYADEQGRVWGTPARRQGRTHRGRVQQRAWICGTAEEFVAFLREA